MFVRVYESYLTPFGKYPGARSIEQLMNNGIIVLDKPQGPTCHEIDGWIKELLGIKKASHGGTLDPRVSGVLVIALGNATKLMPVLLKARKEYIALIYLHKDMSRKAIENSLKQFVGKIKQTPPKRAAVARVRREREVYYIDIVQISGRYVLLKIGCEAGTYIRKLADDLGKALGCGAHLQELRRTRSGIFSERDAHTLQELCDALAQLRAGNENLIRQIVMPMERVVDEMKAVVIKDSAIAAITSGAPLTVRGIVFGQDGIKKGDLVAMLSLKGELVAFGPAAMSSSEMAKAKKGIAVKTDRVLMRQGVYPR